MIFHSCFKLNDTLISLLIFQCLILSLQIEELTISLPTLQASSSSNSSLDSSASSTDITSPPVKRNPLSTQQGGARKALLRWVQYTATKYGVHCILEKQCRKLMTSLLVEC